MGHRPAPCHQVTQAVGATRYFWKNKVDGSSAGTGKQALSWEEKQS